MTSGVSQPFPFSPRQSFDQMKENLELPGQLKVFDHNVDMYRHYWDQHTDMMREIYGGKGGYIITDDKLMIKQIVPGKGHYFAPGTNRYPIP
jgi:hypothetical protein